MRSGMANVGDAELYFEIRGSGPYLLLISGAGGDAGYYSGLAEDLANAFTVINYDRRGNSRSTGRSKTPMTVAQQSDDARALIEQLAGGKSLVFGNSGGAIVALDLAARHPNVLHGVIAHEPPVTGVLPGGDPWRSFFDRIGERYHEAGSQAAAFDFVQTVRGEGSESSYTWPQDLQARFLGNAEHLFGNEWPAWGRFLPDEAALRDADFPIILGAGSADRGLYYARPSVEIAQRIGVPWVEFPGIHFEFLPRPALFAAAVRVLACQMHTAANPVPEAWNKDASA